MTRDNLIMLFLGGGFGSALGLLVVRCFRKTADILYIKADSGWNWRANPYPGAGSLWFETPIPIIPYNGILKTQLKANVDQRIDDIIQHFSRKEAQFMWIVHPSSEPSDLRERLQKRGLKYVEPIFGMVRGLDDLLAMPPVPDNIEIRKFVDE